jgi:hypothetical protein
MQQLDDRIDRMLAMPVYAQAPEVRESQLLELLKEEVEYACVRHSGYRSYVEHWPQDYQSAERICDLPYLPVGMLKANPPLSLVSAEDVRRTLTSSATTSQLPSRVVLDAPTSRRMTKGTVIIARDFIGPSRRPYLVVDTPDLKASRESMGARAAAIQGLQPFATETTYCLRADDQGELTLELETLMEFAHRNREAEILIYGFTYILWNYLVKPIQLAGSCLNLRNARIMHSGGWKRLQSQAVEKEFFNEQLAVVVGCEASHIIDFYGMVESVGVIFPDCQFGNKHAPVFGDVIVRDPLTLEPVATCEYGIVQVCSALPTSFPGNLLLTEDMAQVIAYDGCACGRRGLSFRFAGRVPRAEIRGCGNIDVKRSAVN